jgi:glycosyltransferase involved in cell wall biosynthesis
MNTRIKNQDIVITGLQSWDIEIGSNCKNIAAEFSKNNRVLYVNPPMDRLTLWANKNSMAIQSYRLAKLNLRENPIQIQPNLWVYYPVTLIESISRLTVGLGFDILNKRNNKLFAKEIRKAMDILGFGRHIHFCDSDMFRSLHLKELLDPELYIYYTRDNLLAVDYWKTQGTRVEPLHMAQADLVLANSTYLARLASEFNPSSHFVGQGCDLSAYKPDKVSSVPSPIAKIPKPIIGYIGSLTSLRLDMGIIEHIARSKPEWNIVLVGPEDKSFSQSTLHQLQNVMFLGSKEEKELPAYLKAFDVSINPQVFNEVTIGNYPRKIDEYLAMGTPVVATRTEAMEYFGEHVSLAKTKEDWVEMIARELNSDSPVARHSRMEFAGKHTWENNVAEIYKYIHKAKNHELINRN